MTQRRSLIVVSNRGPVSYGRDAAGARVARRGGGGLVDGAARSRRAPRRDVDRERDDGRGSRGRRRDGGGRSRSVVPAAARLARPGGVRPATTTWSRIRCSGSSSTTCGGSGTRPDSTESTHARGTRATMLVNRELRGRGSRRARPTTRRGGVLPRLPPLSRAGARARGRARTRLLAHFVHIPWPSRLLASAAGRPGATPCTTACSRTTSSASTPSAGAATSCAAATTCSARGRAPHVVASRDLGRRRASSTGSLRATPVLAARSERRRDAAGAARRARRPHRSVEEHRPRLPRLRL